MQRYQSIDILRGLAIVLMIQVHFVENLSFRENSSAWLYDLSTFLGALPAPFFAFLSGSSYALWLRKLELTGRKDGEITRVTLRRGLFLFGVGIAFNFFVWLPEETFNWDILTLLGTSLLFLAYARKIPLPVLTLICVMIILISPPLRVATDYPAYWDDHTYSYDFTMEDVGFGFLANGFFPVFPWIVFPILGFVSSDWIFHTARTPKTTPWWLIAASLALMALGGIGVAFGTLFPAVIAQYYASGLAEFPASTEYVVAMIGFIFLSLVLLHRWVDQTRKTTKDGRLVSVLGRYSYFSLSVYILHHMVILWPLWIYGAYQGHDDATHLWRQAMSTPLAFALAIAFVIVCYAMLVLLERNKKPGLETLMRWLCD